MSPSLSRILFSFVFGAALCRVGAQSWTMTSAPITNWSSIACSADGTKVVALGSWQIYLSTNSGLSWAAKIAPSGPWISASSSANGDMLVAAQDDDFVQLLIYASANGGADWGLVNSMGYTRGIACSADGWNVVRVESPRASHNANVGNIYRSTNGGIDWLSTSAPLLRWQSVACSADGSRLVAGCYGSDAGGGPIYSSTNGGTSWDLTSAPPKYWASVASCVNGSKLVAAAHYDAGGYTQPGSVYVSVDAGLTWTSSTPMAYWTGVASSSDGTKIVAVAGALPPDLFSGPIYSSEDSGRTWTSNSAPILSWSAVASSVDGSTRFAAAYGGGIYKWQTAPKPVLEIIASGAGPLLSWTAPSINFVLQQTPDLSLDKWATVPLTPTLNYTNLQYQVSIAKLQGTVFYRLASQ
jgi:hypothetical protein